MRPIDVDLDAATAAYQANDDAAFATAIAPLGIDLATSALYPFVQHSTGADVANRCLVALRALYRAITDDAGVALEKTVERHIAVAVRLDDRIVLGATYWNRDDPYGWPEIRRWYKDVSRNRRAMVAWATTDPRPMFTISVPLRARAAVAVDEHPDREAELLAAVLAAPDDNAPRLVYADYLIERGDPRGEFIQLQCAPSTLEVEQRLFQVKKLVAPAFEALVDGARYTTKRGFIDAVRMTSVTAVSKIWKPLLAAHPLRELHVEVATDRHLARLAELGVSNLCGLSLSTKDITKLALDAPEVAPLFAGRESLYFGNIEATGLQWLSLLSSPACADVRHLAIRAARIDADIVEILGDATIVPHLAWLQVGYIPFHPLTPAQLAAVANLGARPKLARVDDLGWRTPEDDFAAMSAMLSRSNFVELDYGDRFGGEALARALLESPRSRSLRKLRIRASAATFAALAASPYLTDCTIVGP